MYTITITPTPRDAIKVTGAALRSVLAAECAADNIIAVASAAAATLTDLVNTRRDLIDATWCAAAWRASEAWDKAVTSLESLGGRYVTRTDSTQSWQCVGGQYCRAADAVDYAASGYRKALVEAGVPMAPLQANADIATYWDDAAARGC